MSPRSTRKPATTSRESSLKSGSVPDILSGVSSGTKGFPTDDERLQLKGALVYQLSTVALYWQMRLFLRQRETGKAPSKTVSGLSVSSPERPRTTPGSRISTTKSSANGGTRSSVKRRQWGHWHDLRRAGQQVHGRRSDLQDGLHPDLRTDPQGLRRKARRAGRTTESHFAADPSTPPNQTPATSSVRKSRSCARN